MVNYYPEKLLQGKKTKQNMSLALDSQIPAEEAARPQAPLDTTFNASLTVLNFKEPSRMLK